MATKDRTWKPQGKGWTCPPWDIGPYYVDGTTLVVLWRAGKAVGHFEDEHDAMARAKEIEREEACKT